jgi:nitrogen-specific signal transduction histidine kinase
MADIEIIKSLLQMGAAGVLIIAGAGMLKFLREERADRSGERKAWFDRLDRITESLTGLAHEITAALAELRSARGQRCPLTGADRQVVEEITRRVRATQEVDR